MKKNTLLLLVFLNIISSSTRADTPIDADPDIWSLEEINAWEENFKALPPTSEVRGHPDTPQTQRIPGGEEDSFPYDDRKERATPKDIR